MPTALHLALLSGFLQESQEGLIERLTATWFKELEVRVSAVRWWEEIKDSWVQGGWGAGTWVLSLLGLCPAHMESCCRLLPGGSCWGWGSAQAWASGQATETGHRELTSQC